MRTIAHPRRITRDHLLRAAAILLDRAEGHDEEAYYCRANILRSADVQINEYRARIARLAAKRLTARRYVVEYRRASDFPWSPIDGQIWSLEVANQLMENWRTTVPVLEYRLAAKI